MTEFIPPMVTLLQRINPVPVLVDIASGLRSFALAYCLLVLHWRQLLPACLRTSFWALLVVCACSGALRIATMPFRLLFANGALVAEWTTWNALASAVALGTVYCLQGSMPHVCREAFFEVLELRDPPLAATLRSAPVLRNLLRQLFLCAALLVGFVMVGLVVGVLAGPAVVTLLTSIGVACVVYWWILLPVALVLVIGYYLYDYVLYPLFAVDRVLGSLLLVSFVLGICSGAVWDATLKAAMLYCTSTWLTEQLLAQYSVRQTLHVWNSFRTRHRWRIFGFGLASSAVLHAQPLLGLALLGTLQATSASLLVDLCASDIKALATEIDSMLP